MAWGDNSKGQINVPGGLSGVVLVAAGEFHSLAVKSDGIAASGDFNQDQKPDLLFQHANGTLAVWYMDGTVYSSAALVDPSQPDSSDWRARAVADLNGDGHPDIILQRLDGAIKVWLMHGRTRVGLAALSPYSGTDEHWSIAGAGDFNGDEKADLVFQHSNGDLAVWYLNNFVAEGFWLVPSNSGDPRLRLKSVVDRNRDGQPDLLFQNQTDGTLVIWFMNGINRTSAPTVNPASPGPAWEVVGP